MAAATDDDDDDNNGDNNDADEVVDKTNADLHDEQHRNLHSPLIISKRVS